MAKERLIVIGAVAAGTKAASKAKRDNPSMDVKVFTREEHISYAGCGLPYYIGGVIKEKQELLVRTPEIFKAEQDIDIYIRHEVKAVDISARTVSVVNLDTQEQMEYPYDRLIIATGASPVVPPLPNVKLGNIFTLRSVSDAFAMRELVDGGGVSKAVVVGGGFIGLEAAENLKHRGIEVTIIELAPHILPSFDEEIALYGQKYMSDKGIEIITGHKVTGFAGEDSVVKSVETTAGSIEADIVILAIGVRPNTALAAAAGIELGPTGAIKVNEYMETNIKDIYAVGDCAENINLITGKPAWYPMGSTSNKTGRIAGHNAAISDNKDRASLEGVLGTTIVKLFELSAAKTGLSEKEALREGYEIESILVPANDKAHYYPGNKPIITKLIADKSNGRILGAQIIGMGIADKPIDTIATAITFGARLEQLAKLDLAYAPPFSMAMSSTILSANVLDNKLGGRLESISAPELKKKLEAGAVNVLDVREEIEYFISAIPGAVNIPMNELESKIAEIDRARETVLVCKVGKRAFLSYLKLRELGFENIKILEGGISAYPYELV